MRTLALALPLLAAPAAADTCWRHGDAVLRLVAAGDYRALLVEVPDAALRARGVPAGARLFEGVDLGGWLVGSALDLDAACAERAILYVLEGPTEPGQVRLDLGGERQVHEGCRPTGRRATATLNLTLAGEC